VQLRPVRQRIRDLRERLDARWDELTTEESRLIDAISEDRDFQQGELQARIDEIQEEIEALWDEQRDLERQQENLSYTADDMQAFLRAVKRAVVPTIPEAQEALEQADAPLDTHAEAQEQALTEPVSRRFQTDRVAIEDIVDFSDQAREVFRQARAGAQTFDAELSWEAQHSLTSAAHDDLDDQQEAMSVEVPALAEETMEVVEGHLQRAEDLLAEAQRVGELPSAWQDLLRQLQERYPGNPERFRIGGYDPWDEWREGRWRQ